jgi:RNA polymerase sigma-70 factor (ECF subfamily)
MASLACKNVIYSTQIGFKFHSFDEDYLQRLAGGDAVVEHHFGSYFGDLLLVKLRVRIRSPQLIEDIRQETLLRVLQIVRRKGVDHPERFGGFVCSVCNNVMLELVRRDMRHERLEAGFEPPDETVDLDASLVTQQTRRQVETVLNELPAKDREILRMLFLQDSDLADVSSRFGVTEDYRRVLLHRAKSRFRRMYAERYAQREM